MEAVPAHRGARHRLPVLGGTRPAAGAIGYVSVVVAPWAFPIYAGLNGAAIANRIIDLAAVSAPWRTMGDQLPRQPDGQHRIQVVATTLAHIAATARWPVRTARLIDAITEVHRSRPSLAMWRSPRGVCISYVWRTPDTVRPPIGRLPASDD